MQKNEMINLTNLKYGIIIFLSLFITIGLSIFIGLQVSKNDEETQSKCLEFIINPENPYEEVLQSYQEYASYIINDDIETVLEQDIFSPSIADKELAYRWQNMLVETNIWSYRDFQKDQSAFGYALADLNGDIYNELILLLKDYTVLAIFMTVDNDIRLVDAYWPKHRCAIYDTRVLYTLTTNGASQWYYRTQCISLENKKLELLLEYGSYYDGYYKVIDEEMYNIDENEFIEFQEKYPALSDIMAKSITEESGLEFIPLFNG